VICGVITNNSVDATVRVAGNLGFRVWVPEDATATFELAARNGRTYGADEVHAIFLTNLDGEYPEVTGTVEILAALDALPTRGTAWGAGGERGRDP